MKRYRRFTLKLLLLATALCAVLFAVVRPYASHAWLRYRLIQHGVTFVAFDEQGRIDWLRVERTNALPEILQLDDCSALQGLDLARSEVNSSLACLAGLTELQLLDFNGSTLDDQSAQDLTDVTAASFIVNNTKLSASGLASILARNHFQVVSEAGTSINRQQAEDLSEEFSVEIVID